MKTILVVGLKGGTGKSTISAMLATYLAQSGKDTILVDADVDSPNLADVLKIDQEIKIEPNRIEVAHLDNMDFFSFGLITKDKAISMRGDSYVQMLLDVLQFAEWKVDVRKATMIIDCPAGASDLFKGVLRAYYQTIVGAVVVTIPSAWRDLKRILDILNYYGVPVIGVVKNMAYFKCEHGTEYRFFGNGKVELICDKYEVDFLGEVPISPEIYEAIEAGLPVVPGEVIDVLDKIVNKVKKMKPVGPSLLERLYRKVSDKVKKNMVKVIANTIIKLNKSVDLKQLTSSGFGGNVIEFIVLNQGEIVTQVYLKLTDGRLIVLKEPKTVNLTIMCEVDTLFKVAKGELDLETAYFMGEIEILGSTGTTRAFSFFQKMWQHMKDEILEVVGDGITG